MSLYPSSVMSEPLIDQTALCSDVTKREALDAAFRTISATMPPIAGVVQGAMVLSDTMFADTTLETVDTVLGPKVQGSIYLDEIFYSTPLDFFVFLSSVASTSGNPGQSIYAGANMFMNSLAAQRRKRGVPGSSVEIGAIMGNGSVTSKLSFQQQQYLFSVGNMWMSEQDFLTMFAEAVLASPPGSPQSVTTATGLRLHYSDDKPDITWFSNPIFQHLVLETGNAMPATAGASKQGVPVKTQLLDAKSSEEVFSILKGMCELLTVLEGAYEVLRRCVLTTPCNADAFHAKLLSSLQADSDRDVLELPLETLGMDSLVAVDLRSWFLKELSVDVPVLKILNGGTAKALLEFVQGIIPESMTPKLKLSDGSVTVEAASAAQPKPTTQNKQPSVVPPFTTIPAVTREPLKADSDRSSAVSTRTPSHTQSVDADKTAVELDAISETTVSSSSEPTSSQTKLLRTVPISFGQSRFWFLRSYVSDPLAFNITSLMRINGPLRVDDFARAVDKVTHHHEALRTSFVIENNVPVQKVWSSPAFELEKRAIANDEREVIKAYEAIKNNVYKLEEGKTMRLQLLSKSPSEHVLVLGYHHINMDGISFEVFFGDLEKAYNDQPFGAPVIQYPDFSMREANEYKSGHWTSELAYWHTQFGDLPEPTPLLPVSKKLSRPANLTYATHTLKRRLSAEQSRAIQDVCRKFKATPFHFYLAVFKALVARHSGAEDFCIGIADANRKESNVMEAIGLYLNLLPLRVGGKLTQTFGEALAEMRRKSQEAFANSKVPFDILLNELNVPRSSSHAPLFQTFLNYRRGISETRPFCGCTGSGELISGGQIGYDISVDIVENPEGDSLVLLAVQQDLYGLEEASLLLDNYFNLLGAFSKNPASSLNRPAIYDAAAVDKALRLGCGLMYEFTWPETLIHRIEDMSTKYATKVALKDGQGHHGLTYSQLAARVNAIAAQLIGAQINGGIVGVMQASTLDFVCSILAIWKVGATYVALDPRLSSTDRLAAIVRECQPTCILVDSSTKELFGQLVSIAVQVDVSATPNSVTSSNIPTEAKATSAAAVLYTSGSTGTPKGISLSHASLRNNIELATHQFGFKEGADIMLQQAAFSFDMSLSQTLTALANGGTLVVAPTDLRGDAASLSQLIAAENVTFTQGTPTEYASWIGSGAKYLKGSKWRVAGCGGEKMAKSLLRAFRSLAKLELRLFNVYGPSETSFTSNTREIPYHESDSSADIPLTTWPNYSVYVVDRDLKPVPSGVSGEVCIGGAGVGLGYLGNEKLTSRAFIADKFAPPEFIAKGWKTMHRSGDRGRLSSDGGLILEGRIVGDTQIKLRGIRMDLREIESAILQAGRGQITDAAVSVRQANTESAPQYLVAHVVIGGNDSPIHGSNQQDFLAQVNARLTLPLNMKPSLLVPISSLPLGSSHKLDRRALQTLPISNTDQADQSEEAELTPNQADIRELWKEVIPSDVSNQYSITPQTDFFHVGGTSLLLVNLQGLFEKKYGKAPPLRKIFESSTLTGMTALLFSDGTPDDQASLPTIIDWDDETSLPASSPTIIPNPPINTRATNTTVPPRIAVLTGATGFLGRHLLTFLLRQPSIIRIHCIAVRNAPSSSSSPFSDPRVRIYKGNLASPHLGLNPADALSIFAEADVVIHNGADVSFLKTYATLRLTNVQSTRELAQLAAPRRIPVHFVSSASVAQLTGQDEVGESSVAAWPPPADARELTGGYTAAKWASEVFLEKAAQEWEIPVTIHRPSSITGEGAGDLDLMGNLFKYVEDMEAVPESGVWKGYFDFVSVENVAAEIVKAAVTSDLGEGEKTATGVRYLYEAGDIVYPLSVVREMSESGGQLPVKTMPLGEWVQEARKRGLNSMLAEYLLSADRTDSALAFPKLVKGVQGGGH